jgi:4-amino-4-deoxy-L-arabinose transferase-like glycosyltransferase
MTSENTKIERQPRSPIGRFVWIVFVLLTISVYFFGLTIPFVGPDEPRYAQVAREMLERGDWITPTLGGVPWFEKPPLLYWLEILSYKLFGINEFAARFGPALCGLGTIVSLWLLGRSLSKMSDFANFIALAAASDLAFITFSHAASFDIVVTFSITAALASFFIWRSKSEAGTASPIAPLILFYVFIGIGLLAKGLSGIVLPFAIVGVSYALSRRFPSRQFLISLSWGTVVACSIAAVWYLPMYQRYGDAFINEFFIQHHFQRFTTNKYLHPQPFYFFFWVLPLMLLPWLPFSLSAIWAASKRLFQKLETESIEAFAAAWLIVPLVFFSFSGSKLPGYILPAVPGAVLLTSKCVFDLARKSYRWRNVILAIAASTFGAVILLQAFALTRFAESNSIKSLIQTADTRGFTGSRVMMLHTISYGAEFYAAGRLSRDPAGKLVQLEGVGEVMREIEADGGNTVLVIVPAEYLSQLTEYQKITTEVLKQNGRVAIAAVSANR